MSLVVTATDTEVGKTIVSALLLHRYSTTTRLAYWKPIATGSDDDRDTNTIRALAGDVADVKEESFLFRQPLSPHLAARLESRAVDLGTLQRDFKALDAVCSPGLVVEGIGGLLVPLVDHGPLLIDLLQRFALPMLIVARSTLGTINHTLLTLEAARHRGLDVAGVVLVGPPNQENRDAIQAWGQTRVVAEVPWLPKVNRQTVALSAQSFDPSGLLESFFNP